MASSSGNLPFGYRFYPTNDEVIHHLNEKIFGKKLPALVIPTADIYRLNPEELPLDQFKHGVAGEWFFFTARPAGDLLTKDGYWHPRDLPTEIDLDDKIIGFKQVMDFYWGIPPNGTKSNWTIYEYRLNPDELEGGQVDQQTEAKHAGSAISKSSKKLAKDGNSCQLTITEQAHQRMIPTMLKIMLMEKQNSRTGSPEDDTNDAENHVNGETN